MYGEDFEDEEDEEEEADEGRWEAEVRDGLDVDEFRASILTHTSHIY
jgi:hypothetical protein